MESLEKLEKRKKEKMDKLAGARAYVAETQRELDEVQNKINLYKPLIVTDHFILRYIERVYGLDMDAIKKEILEKFSDVPLVAKMSNKGAVYTKENLSVVVKNSTLVTVYEK
jgi:hypothetical protein